MRIKLTIEYNGAPFAGWQRQQGVLSVQQAIEEAIQAFIPLPDIRLFVAGRTDAGVHALGQIAHVDLPEEYSPDTVRRATNFHLKDLPISILKAEIVDSEFHARFSAKKRSYLYRILNRPDKLTLEKGRAWYFPFPVKIETMQQGADLLLGRHDFSAFRTVHCQAASPIRTLESFSITKTGDLIECHISAPSFLHHQVRNMVGTLSVIGRGKWEPDKIREILKSQDRSQAGPTAPAEGLYLVKVEY